MSIRPETVSRADALPLLIKKATTAKNLVVHEWYRLCAQSEFTWRCIANLRPWLEFQWLRKPLSPVQERLVATLKRDGVVVTSVTEIMGSPRLFEELQAAVSTREALAAERINEARKNMDMPEIPGRVKTYFVALLGTRPTLQNDIFFRFCLQSEVLNIANAYFGMWTRLRHYNVWHNFPTRLEPRESQLWHRDPEDRCILKMFVYLTDVDEGAGPLTYAPGTHARGSIKTTPDSRLMREGAGPEVHRSDDAQMSAVVPQHKWITAVGPKGTIVFADTRGFHKGGWSRDRDRLVYMCTFTSNASTLLADLFERQLHVPTVSDRATAFAIGA